jgi:hypothetical protein
MTSKRSPRATEFTIPPKLAAFDARRGSGSKHQNSMDDDLVTRCLRAEQDAAESRRILHAIQSPIDAIGNLSYLACLSVHQPEQARAYLAVLDQQVALIATMLRAYYKPPQEL